MSDKYTWKYVSAPHVHTGSLVEKLTWCVKTLGPYGHGWAVRYNTADFLFCFKQQEHCVMFDLVWADYSQ